MSQLSSQEIQTNSKVLILSHESLKKYIAPHRKQDSIVDRIYSNTAVTQDTAVHATIN